MARVVVPSTSVRVSVSTRRSIKENLATLARIRAAAAKAETALRGLPVDNGRADLRAYEIARTFMWGLARSF